MKEWNSKSKIKLQRWTLYWAALLILFACGIGLGCFVVDPLGVYSDYSPRSLDLYRSDRFLSRVGKAELWKSTPCLTVILGSSRVEVGIRPQHPSWQQTPVCNLGLSAGTSDEATEVLARALERGDVREVFWGLDFFSFNDWRAQGEGVEALTHDFKESLFNPKVNSWRYVFESLLGYRFIVGSYQVLENLLRDNRTLYDELGFRVGHKNPQTLDQIKSILSDNKKTRGLYDNFEYQGGSLARMRATLDNVCSRDMQVNLVWLPVHAYDLEFVRSIGMQAAYRRWQRGVVALVDSFSTCRAQITLWDFTGYQSPNIDEFPTRSGEESRFYWEPSHFKPELGDRVLDAIHGHLKWGKKFRRQIFRSGSRRKSGIGRAGLNKRLCHDVHPSRSMAKPTGRDPGQ